MRFQELTTKTAKELGGLLAEARGKLHTLRMKRSVGQVKDVRELRELRLDIAHLVHAISTVTKT